METNSKDLYKGEEITNLYAAYRPDYPQEVFDKIMDYHNDSELRAHQMAVDVCCGTGRGTIPLTQYFTKVVGVDISEDQLKHVPNNIPNLETRLAAAEDLSMIGSNEVDLVTIGMALHFVDEERFFSEVLRILKPGGTFVAYSYTWDTLDNEEAESVMDEIRSRFVKYYGPLSTTLFSGYRFTNFPFTNIVRFDDIQMQTKMTLDQYIGFLGSLHTTHLYDRDNVHEQPLAYQAKERLIAILGDEPDVSLNVAFPVFMVLGRKN